MKLLQALEILKQPIPKSAPQFKLQLACGFTALHLQTFLAAHLQLRNPHRRVSVDTGLFGDLAGNIERLDSSTADALTVVIEWEDLDPRLGIRRLGGWRQSMISDIVQSAERAATRLRQVILTASRRVPTVVCTPTLPLPPLFWTQPENSGSFELRLHQVVAELAVSLLDQPNVRVANEQRLSEISPPGQRFDPKAAVKSGFPYTLQHASALAGLLTGLIEPVPAKKGLITDLDGTLWSGIVGEDGVQGISWHLDDRTQMHGLYQQFLASLASAGVLIGVASKNDPGLVEQAFGRNDLLLAKADIYPFEVHWSRKSESVKRILETWNVSADSVVFLDDSPMEVAEVQGAFPEMECLKFPGDDYAALWALLKHLRSRFAKAALSEEDELRLQSIRNAAAFRALEETAADSTDDFLLQAGGRLTFDPGKSVEDARAFELVNKTNQFNLNGKRYDDAAWSKLMMDSGTSMVMVSYEDKFGKLGRIGVLLGRKTGKCFEMQSWVMSCRAFSRRIEFHCLEYLFENFGVADIALDLQPTGRNGPIVEFIQRLADGPVDDKPHISRSSFLGKAPKLPHQVEEVIASEGR
jgi:FkbH-like protein